MICYCGEPNATRAEFVVCKLMNDCAEELIAAMGSDACDLAKRKLECAEHASMALHEATLAGVDTDAALLGWCDSPRVPKQLLELESSDQALREVVDVIRAGMADRSDGGLEVK